MDTNINNQAMGIIGNSSSNGYLTDSQIDEIAKAFEDVTPEEVIKMEKSKNNIDINTEKDYEAEIRSISADLDNQFESFLNGDAKTLRATDQDIFDLTENGEIHELTDEEIESSVKNNFAMFDLSDEDIMKFMSIISRYRNKQTVNVYDELPDSIKTIIKNMVNENIPKGEIPSLYYNRTAKMIIDDFISQAELDRNFINIEKSLDEALKIPSISDLYFEHTKENVMDKKIPALIESIKDEYPMRAKLLGEIRDIFYEAFSLERLKKHYNEVARTRKLIRRDYEKAIEFCDEFNLKNKNSKFIIPDCTLLIDSLTKIFIDDDNKEISRIKDMNITEKDIMKFAVLFGRHCMNYDPSEIHDAAYMYYSLKNIIMLNSTNETKTPVAVELINNICDIIEFIRVKEAEFNDSNDNRRKSKKK